jgi:exonuclease SbcC
MISKNVKPLISQRDSTKCKIPINPSTGETNLLPLTLVLSNFLSWQHMSTPLDLTGIGLACLCGDNGHGKSALLDAITWVLWGESRAERQESLIYQGAREMSVELEFLARDQRYKVVRKHISSTRGRQGRTELELLHVSESTQIPITGNSVRHTEDVIKELLNMDYSTFINTSFLMQGKADQFATSKPAERKTLLADVLDLRKYDRISERARAKARDHENHSHRLRGELERLEAEISDAPKYQLAAQNVAAKLQQVNTDLARVQNNVITLQEQVESQRNALRQSQEAINTIAILTKTLEQVSRQQADLWERIESNLQILDRRIEIEQGYEDWKSVLVQSNEMETKRATFEVLTYQKQELEQEIELEKQRLISRSDVMKETILSELTPKATAVSAIEASLERLEIQQTSLGRDQSAISQTTEELSEVSNQIQQAKLYENNRLAAQKETVSRLDLIAVAGALCPVCGEELNDLRRQDIKSQLELTQQGLLKTIAEIQTALQNQINKETLLASDIRQKQLVLNDQKKKIDIATTEAYMSLKSAKEAATTRSRTIDELEGISRTLELASFAQEKRIQLASITNAILNLAYDANRHRKINFAIHQDGERYQRDHTELQLADAAITTDQNIYENLINQSKEQATMLTALKGTVVDLEISSDSVEQSMHRLEQVASTSERLQQESDSLLLNLREATWQLDRIKALHAAKETLKSELERVTLQKNTFQELSITFGKNGLQAYMIDEALPELEYESAEMLGKLTNNRMSVRLETQRERRSSKGLPPRETLDILVADEKGTRPYELFSGGEAFRVNFALRIALSRMLARRAGTPLPTLFIDEGFGTQDAEGRSLLIESINAIREDFECILVVTHIDEIKDAFPFRIEIVKTAEAGSTFRIS